MAVPSSLLLRLGTNDVCPSKVPNEISRQVMHRFGGLSGGHWTNEALSTVSCNTDGAGVI